VLTGPNGSGKSSLLRVLAGLTPPAAGHLAWGGAPVGEDPAAHRARLHFIGHQDALKPLLSAQEVLSFWASMHGRGTGRIDAALDRFRLQHRREWPCRLLSAGQKRRLALARLVASPAAVWLHAEAVEDLLLAVSEHRAEGGRVVLSTHTPLPLERAQSLSLADFQPAAYLEEDPV
jgi:heme exporter protein A